MSEKNKKILGGLAIAFIGTFLAMYAHREWEKRKAVKALESSNAEVEA